MKAKQGFSAPWRSQLVGSTPSFGFTVAKNARRDDPTSTTGVSGLKFAPPGFACRSSRDAVSVAVYGLCAFLE